MKASIGIALAVLLLLSFGCTGTTNAGLQKAQAWGWLNIVGLAMMVVLLLLGIGYMAGSVLGDDKLKSWTKQEVGQVFFTAIIIIAAVALVGSVDYWLKTISLAGSPQWQSYVNNAVCCTPGSTCLAGSAQPRGRACHIEIATDYLQFMYESSRLQAKSMLAHYAWYAFLAHMSVGFSGLFKELASLNSYPFAGLEVSAEYYSLLFDLTAKTMMLIRAQQVFLDFMWYPIFPVMLSMGLFFRVLYFTRKLGGLLIALALSFYIVFPMFYVLANGILWGFTGPWTGVYPLYGLDYNGAAPPLQQDNLDLGLHAKDVFDSSVNLNIDYCDSATIGEKQELGGLFDNFRGTWGVVEGGRWYEQAWDFIDGGIFAVGLFDTSAFGRSGPIGTLATTMVFTLFLPFLALMTTLSSFKVLSPLIGGDVEISLLSRLI